MTQCRQGVRSTHTRSISADEELNAAYATACATTYATPGKLAAAYAVAFAPTATREIHYFDIALDTLFTDCFGRFPIRALSGNQYIMCSYHVGANVILVQPYRTRHNTHRIPAYNTIMERLAAANVPVHMQVLDNEVSAAYLDTITRTWKCKYQLVPLDMHQRNAAKRAIRTMKAHFLTILAGVDPGFPKSRWDLLLPQAELTINLLCQSRYHPALSAWAGLNGPYNFDATPMAPPGCKVIAHAKGSTRLSWDFRGKCGYYVGPALSHYRCYKVIRTATQAVVVSDTVTFQHHTLAIPTISPKDRIIHCLRSLVTAVRQDKSPDSANEQLKAIESLRSIFTPNPTCTPNHQPARVLPALPPRVRPVSPPQVLPDSPPRVLPNSPPRVACIPPRGTPAHQPIARRTRSYGVTMASVTFSLPPTHIDKDSTCWRRACATTQPHKTITVKRNADNDLQHKLNGTWVETDETKSVSFCASVRPTFQRDEDFT